MAKMTPFQPFGGYQKWHFGCPNQNSETTFIDLIPPPKPPFVFVDPTIFDLGAPPYCTRCTHYIQCTCCTHCTPFYPPHILHTLNTAHTAHTVDCTVQIAHTLHNPKHTTCCTLHNQTLHAAHCTIHTVQIAHCT